MYNEFASIYDELISQDIEYNKVCDYIENIFDYYDKNPSLVCDLACGTGNITIPMSQRGYNMIGVDISENMLNIAKSKAGTESDVLFLKQDLKKLDLFGTCDAFLCITDGFNYITNYNVLKKIFTRIRKCFIENDGIFIFDLSSEYKLKHTLGNNTFVYNTDEIFYTWENSYKEPFSKFEINFFKKENGLYNRYEEIHIQRSYSANQIISALKESGFSEVNVYGGYTFDSPKCDEQRLVFVALS